MLSQTANDAGDHRQFELKADHYAAFTLARMGAQLPDLLHAVDMIADENDGLEHPGRAKREAAVKEAFSDSVPGPIAEKPLSPTDPNFTLPQTNPNVRSPVRPPSSNACQTGNLLYDSQCASCDRLRLSIIESERNGNIAVGGRMSYYNNCTVNGILLVVPAPSASAKLSASDYQQCVQTRLQISEFEQVSKGTPGNAEAD